MIVEHDGNTTIKLTTILLNNHNYPIWSKAAINALCGKGKYGYVTGSVGKPSVEDEAYEKWFQVDKMVLTWILNSIESNLMGIFACAETAKELWDSIKTMYGQQRNLMRVYELKSYISKLNQGEMSVIEYLGKFKAAWEELRLYRPETNDMHIILARANEDRVFAFLEGLNSSFKDIRNQILRNQDMPPFDEVCHMVNKEETSQRVLDINLYKSETNALIAQEKARNEALISQAKMNSNIIRPRCEHCHKIGHVKDKCWILHPHLKPIRDSKGKAYQPNAQNAISGSSISMTKETPLNLEALAKFIQNQINANSKSEGKSSGKCSSEDGNISNSSISTIYDSWIIDSGASDHMFRNSDKAIKMHQKMNNQTVKIANGDSIPIKCMADIELFSKDTKGLYVPNFASNLLSVSKVTKDLNCFVIFGPNKVIFQDITTGKRIGEGKLQNGLYMLEDKKRVFNASKEHNDHELWHARLGHPSNLILKSLIPDLNVDNTYSCEACIFGKQSRLPFAKSDYVCDDVFDLIHSDVWTSPMYSHDNYKYFITFIDHKSRYTWVYLLKYKSDAFACFKRFTFFVANQFGKTIKILRTDNGGEYVNHVFKDFLVSNGIIHQTSCPYTPEQNGIAERKNKHLLEVARSMMFHSNVPKRYWGEAVLTGAHLINRAPSKVLNGKSPNEVMYNRKPNLSYLRVFGCTCFVHIPNDLRDKLSNRSQKCMLLGYSTTQKGYKCINPLTNNMIISRNVTFLENEPYFTKHETDLGHKGEHMHDIIPRPIIADIHKYDVNHNIGKDDHNDKHEEPNHIDESSDHEPIIHHDDTSHDISHENHIDQSNNELSMHDDIESNQRNGDNIPNQPNLRRSSRLRKPPTDWMHNRVFYHGNHVTNHPIQHVYTHEHISDHYKAFLSAIDGLQEPTNYHEAEVSPIWRKAMSEELSALIRNGTWEIVPLPKGKKPVGCKWVYKTKLKSDGSIEKHKARLVAKGFTQTYGIDYTETFAPVAKMNTIRVLISLAVNYDWPLFQMDVKNAFLQGELMEEVYMRIPKGYDENIPESHVCRLKKAIYGLKQSPRAWYSKLHNALTSQSFTKSEADSSLFTKHSEHGITILLIYVDDIIITGSDLSGINDIKAYLKSVFDIKDLGYLRYFLGIELAHSKNGLVLSQRKYALDLLCETGKLGAKQASTPIESTCKRKEKGEDQGKQRKEEEPLQDDKQYQRIVGKLIYLTITRPDICFAVNQVSQYMQKPLNKHMTMVNRILCYLKGTPGQGLHMIKNGHHEVLAYSDSDWAGDVESRKSTTGYCTFVGGNLVTWKSKKQSVVARSSAEAEYRAMASTTCELIWLKALIKDLGFETKVPMKLFCDNQAAICIAENPVFHERTKHIEMDCHFIREKIQNKIISTPYVPSEEQLADVFTKPSTKQQIEVMISKLHLKNLFKPSLRGSVELRPNSQQSSNKRSC